MFACIGRGHHLHEKYNVESNLFNRHFPSVPLFGFFGNGEIGYDYLPEYSKPGKDSGFTLMGQYPDQDHPNVPYIWDMPDIDLSYSTVFVLLSLPGGKWWRNFKKNGKNIEYPAQNRGFRKKKKGIQVKGFRTKIKILWEKKEDVEISGTINYRSTPQYLYLSVSICIICIYTRWKIMYKNIKKNIRYNYLPDYNKLGKDSGYSLMGYRFELFYSICFIAWR